MSKYVPIDAESESRVLDMGRVRWTWYRTWRCNGCQRYGAIQIVLPPPADTKDDDPRWRAATTNGGMAESAERDHHKVSPFCVAGPGRILMGDVYRVTKTGQRVYLRPAGVSEENFRAERWPPWGDG